jgi:heat shock protein HslJ
MSCKPREKDNKGYDPKIENKRWVLRELNSRTIQTPTGQKEISLFFEPTLNEFTAVGKCNDLHGMYTSQDDMIKIVNMISTKMACQELDLESEFIKSLNETNKYKLKSKKTNGVSNEFLYLYKESSLLATFEKVNE